MEWIINLILTILPIGLILLGIYYLNDHEKQPWWMIIISFIGGFATFGLVRFTSYMLDGRVYELSSESPFLTHNWEFFLIAFGMIAVVEELSKYFLTTILTFRSHKFQIPYDGIIYATAVSSGFAFMENIILYNQGVATSLSRAIFTIPAHACFGITMGYYLGLAKSCKINGLQREAFKMKYMAFFIPLVLHGLYDYICNFNVKGASYAIISYTLILYVYAFYKLYKFNQLDFKIYRSEQYKDDDLMIDYDDDINIERQKIEKRLFESHEKGDWNVDSQNVKTDNIDMKMFSGHEENLKQNQ